MTKVEKAKAKNYLKVFFQYNSMTIEKELLKRARNYEERKRIAKNFNPNSSYEMKQQRMSAC